METFLQSKEVKIPKQTAPISSTTSLAANVSIVGANKMLVKEIDFKSSFARSLSITNDDQDDDEFGGIVSGLSPCIEEHTTVDMCNHSGGMKKMLNSETENVIVSCSSSSSGGFNATEIFNKSDEDKERLLWTVDQQLKIDNHSNDAEIFRLRKLCQTLLEENRKIGEKKHLESSTMLLKSQHSSSNGGRVYDQNVENVVLQTKLESLQWQLRQVENSRQMYRAIMEEVEKFLERCHHSFETIQHRTRTRAAVERSRSIANIMKATNASAIENRARSSINLTQDINKKTGFFFSEYNTFKDFTWRRNHKHKEKKKEKYQAFEEQHQQLQQHDEPISLPCFDVPSYQSTTAVDDADDCDVEKLSKEAYRLSRTVHNFLNTHEPILSQTISTSVKTSTVNLKHNKSEMMFDFDHESQISMRSTDESSVHSSSNSSNKEEDDLVQPKISFKNQNKANKIFSSCHQTEDESGFSSMNSFHEVGLPLNSTMMSTNSSSGDESKNESMREKLKKRNVINHRRFNSTPLLSNTTPKLKLLDSEENSMKVLWV